MLQNKLHLIALTTMTEILWLILLNENKLIALFNNECYRHCSKIHHK